MAATIISVTEEVKQTGQRGLYRRDWTLGKSFAVKISARDKGAANMVLGAVDPSTGLAVPQPGDWYDLAASNLICLKTNPELVGSSGLNWRVVAAYGIDATVGSSGSTPWIRKPLIDSNVILYPWVMEEDFDSPPKPAKNSAHDPFDPPLMTSRRNLKLTLHWAQTVATFDLETIQQTLVGKLNAAAVTIRGKTYAIEKLLLHNLSGSEQIYQNGTHYWALTYDFEYEIEVPLKTQKVIDRGYHYFSPTYGKTHIRLPIGDTYEEQNPLTDRRIPCSQPVLMDGGGLPLAPQSGVVSYSTFVTRKTADFTPLLLA